MSAFGSSSFAVRAFGKLILIFAFLLCVSWPLRAGVDANGNETANPDGKDGKSSVAGATTTEEQTEYKNWIELGIGGTTVHGDTTQFEQEHHTPGDEVYGGITDMHYEHDVGSEKAMLTIDGHALWDINDYDVKVKLEKPKFGYIAAGFTEFRTWYDGNGGFFPPHGGTWFAPFFPEMHIDRGEAWVELGLRTPDWPEMTLRYSREFRDGQKDSTTWGDTNRTGGGNVLPGPTRKIVPSFRDIDETRDILSFDASKTFGNTDALLGMRWEHIEDRDDIKMERSAGQLPPPFAGRQRFVTQHNDDDIDLFSGHALTETRFTDNFWFTAGYSYTTVNNDTSGSRIFGTHFDSAFGEPVPTLGGFDHAYLDLAGMAEVTYHVVNANLFWIPFANLSIISGFRYTHENQDTSATFLAEEPVPNTPPFNPLNPAGGFHYGAGTPQSGERQSDYDRYAQRLDLRYTGIKELLLYAEVEFEEECGHVFEFQSDEGDLLDKDTHFLGQKYVGGATWYPLTWLNLAAQYYHKIADYDNDLFNSQHQRLLGQDWDTDNANIRLTVRPKVPTWVGTVVLVSRYDFTRTAIDSKWFHEGDVFQEEQTGVITKHTVSESISWNPLARLYIQANGSVVLNQTETPASEINLIPNTSPTVVDFRNDYWTISAEAGYLLDEKTELHADYVFYCANDHFKNSRVAVPYGMGATEHTVSAGIGRQLNKQMRLTLRYTYFNYDDELFGGHNDYEGHSIFSGLQYRF